MWNYHEVMNMETTDIKLNQTIYYANKPTFTKLLKKLKLKWSKVQINNIIMEGWFNDTQEYIQKLPEEGEFKRFHIVGCLEISEYLISLSKLQSQPRILISVPTEAPWEFDKSYEYKKKTLLNTWNPDFEVRWV